MCNSVNLGVVLNYDAFASWVRRGSWILQFSHNAKDKVHFVMCSRCNLTIDLVTVPEIVSLVADFDGYPFLCEGCSASVVEQWEELITLGTGDKDVY